MVNRSRGRGHGRETCRYGRGDAHTMSLVQGSGTDVLIVGLAVEVAVVTVSVALQAVGRSHVLPCAGLTASVAVVLAVL